MKSRGWTRSHLRHTRESPCPGGGSPDIARRDIDEIHCLGDLVGYGADPNGAIDLIALSPSAV